MCVKLDVCRFVVSFIFQNVLSDFWLKACKLFAAYSLLFIRNNYVYHTDISFNTVQKYLLHTYWYACDYDVI